MKNEKAGSHTPGNWEIGAHDDNGELIVWSPATGGIICNLEADGFHDAPRAEMKANARLISAAPELMNVLTFMVEEFEECHRNNQEIEHHEETGDAMELHRKEEPDCTYCAAIRDARAAIAKAEGEK